MSSPIMFTVPGKPHPCMRARKGAHGNMYDPDENKVAKQAIGIMARAAGVRPVEGAVEIWVSFIFKRPPSHLKKNGELRSTAPQHHIIKPDKDNLEKTVMDGLTKIAWRDDCQVIAGHSDKSWTTETESMTVIEIEEVL